MRKTSLAMMAALDCVDPELGAFITMEPDTALRAASQAPSGRLEGYVVAVKDVVDIAGLPTTYGSPRFADHIPSRTAPVVSALRSEGAVVIGKTNLNEFALGVSGYNPHYGPMLCPHDTLRTVGGSSGGSAVAVASGACTLAIGTDTSGSVRIPAACAGVWGFKCAHGPDLQGVYPLAPTYDSIGYLAARPEILQRLFGIMNLPEIGKIRVGTIGVDLETPALPAEHWTLFRAEIWAVHSSDFVSVPETYGRDIQRHLQFAEQETRLADHGKAREVANTWRQRYFAATRNYDVLVDRVIDGEPPLLSAAINDYETGQDQLRERLLRHTPVANALGWPALAFPTAYGPRQAMGRPGSEAALFAVARSLSRRS